MHKLLLVSLITFTSCQKDSKTSSTNTTDPIYGSWYYQFPGATNSHAKGIIGTIDKDKIFFAYVYVYSDGQSTIFYHRKSEGTYNRDGNIFKINYTYETCNPIGSESFELTASGDQLTVYLKSEGIGYVMLRSKDTNLQQTMLAIEDKNCDILFTKLEKEQKRKVASQKGKSFFSGIKEKIK